LVRGAKSTPAPLRGQEHPDESGKWADGTETYHVSAVIAVWRKDVSTIVPLLEKLHTYGNSIQLIVVTGQAVQA
jgi:hypothetical protein